VNLLRSLWSGLQRLWAGFYWSLANFVLRRAAYEAIEIDLRGGYPERRMPGSPLELPRPARLTHRQLIDLLDQVAADPKIKRVIVRLGHLRVGLARVQEIARALDRIKAADKQLFALLDSIGTREFLLAARCPRRVMPPSAVLSLTGLNLEVMYWRGLLDKADVEPDLLAVGKFKNAAEAFTRTSASEASRQMTEGLLDELYGQIVADLAACLGKTKAQVAKLIDGGPYTPERALKAGLIDKIAYRDELLGELEIKKERNLVRGARYARFMQRRERARARMIDAPIVALVHLHGLIRDGGEAASGGVSARAIVGILRRLRHDKRVKAAVLRISSGGGAATGSDLIRREVANLAAKKPVVVSLGDVAASGGYMAAVGGRTIFAERATLTGSIGVIAGKFAARGLLAKLGIAVEGHQRGATAGIFSGLDKFTDLERRRMNEVMTAMYREFKGSVAAGRKLSAAQVDAVAEGRVWTGGEARERKMIDEVGGVREALAVARGLAGCRKGEPARLIELPAPPSPWRMLRAWNAEARLSQPLSFVEDLREFSGVPFAGLPFRIRIE
jgi:protease-4